MILCIITHLSVSPISRPYNHLSPIPRPYNHLSPIPRPYNHLSPIPRPYNHLSPIPRPYNHLSPIPRPYNHLSPIPRPYNHLSPIPRPHNHVSPIPRPYNHPDPDPSRLPSLFKLPKDYFNKLDRWQFLLFQAGPTWPIKRFYPIWFYPPNEMQSEETVLTQEYYGLMPFMNENKFYILFPEWKGEGGVTGSETITKNYGEGVGGAYMPFCLSVCRSVYLSVDPFIYRSACLPIRRRKLEETGYRNELPSFTRVRTHTYTRVCIYILRAAVSCVTIYIHSVCSSVLCTCTYIPTCSSVLCTCTYILYAVVSCVHVHTFYMQ